MSAIGSNLDQSEILFSGNGLTENAWVKVFRINPDFRIFACQKVHYFFIFPIEIAKFEGFRDY